jgi:hypothetical protein
MNNKTISRSMLAGNSAAGGYDSIQTVTVGSGGQATISFTSIPQTYTHLQIRATSKNLYTGAVGDDSSNMYFNADTTYTNYRTHRLNGNGATVSSNSVQSSGTYILGGGFSVRSYSTYTNMFGVAVTDILDYTNTNKYTTVRMLAGADMNGAGDVVLHSGLWMSTAAISAITLSDAAGNFAQYSSFALYGIK